MQMATRHGVSVIVVRRTGSPVDLGADEGADLDNDVAGCSRDSRLLDIETILRDPRGHNGVEVRICTLSLS